MRYGGFCESEDEDDAIVGGSVPLVRVCGGWWWSRMGIEYVAFGFPSRDIW